MTAIIDDLKKEVIDRLVKASDLACRALGWTEFVGGLQIEYENRPGDHWLNIGFFCKETLSDDASTAENDKLAAFFMDIVHELKERGCVLMRFHYKYEIQDDILFLWHLHDLEGNCLVSPNEAAADEMKTIFEDILKSLQGAGQDSVRSGPYNPSLPNDPKWC